MPLNKLLHQDDKEKEPRKSVTLEVSDGLYGVKQVNFTKGNRVFIQHGTGLSKAVSFLESILIARANDHCKNVFRSHAGIIRENIRQKTENRFVIHPYSTFRWYWELMIVTILAVTLTGLPVQIAFFSNAGKQEAHWVAINAAIDIIFIIDTLLTFRTGYMERQTEVIILQNRQIILHYLKTWFVIDFLSSIPFDLMYEASIHLETTVEREMQLLRYSKALSLLRLMRIVKLLRYIRDLEVGLKIDGTVLSIVHLVLVTVFFIHWNACLQYLVAFMEGFPPESWVAKYDLLRADTSIMERYGFSLYRSVAHMLGMGYGQHTPPTTLTELWIGMMCYVLGGTFYALFIAHVSNLIMSMNLAGRKYEEKVAEVKEYMRFRKVPRSTQSRVMNFYERMYQKKYFDERSILFEPNMSPILRNEILMHNCRKLVLKVSFLKEAPTDFLCEIIAKLQFHVYFPDDVVIKAGTRGVAMYFIEHGELEVKLMNSDHVVKTLHDGDYFGEIALLLDQKTTASIVSSEISDVYRLSRYDFNEVLDNHPSMKSVLQKEALARLRESQMTEVPTRVASENSVLVGSVTRIPDIQLDEHEPLLKQTPVPQEDANRSTVPEGLICNPQTGVCTLPERQTRFPEKKADVCNVPECQTRFPEKESDVCTLTECQTRFPDKESGVCTIPECKTRFPEKKSDVCTLPECQTRIPKKELHPQTSQKTAPHPSEDLQFDSLSRVPASADDISAESIS